MDYVARAKALMKKAALHGALTILPLATAFEAQAASIPLGTVSCVATTDGNQSGCNASGAQLAEQNGYQGIKLFTIGDVVMSSFSGGSFFNGSLLIETSGTYSGSTIQPGTPIPFGAQFTISASHALLNTWQLVLAISSERSSPFLATQVLPLNYATTTFFGSGGGTFDLSSSESFLRSLSDGASVFTYAQFLVNWQDRNFNGTEFEFAPAVDGIPSITINVPSNSLDFNAITSTAEAVPEPASFGLMGLGLAGAWALAKRRGGFSLHKQK